MLGQVPEEPRGRLLMLVRENMLERMYFFPVRASSYSPECIFLCWWCTYLNFEGDIMGPRTGHTSAYLSTAFSSQKWPESLAGKHKVDIPSCALPYCVYAPVV